MNLKRDRTYTYRVAGLYPNGPQAGDYRRDDYGLRGDCAPPLRIAVLAVGGSTTDQR